MTSQQQVSNEQFLEHLTRLFESSSKAHSVFVTHKRITKDDSLKEPTIVVRATDGRGNSCSNRTKFTTHVEVSKLNNFQEAYSNILRTSSAAFLRKRDKAKERRMDKLFKDKRKRMEEILSPITSSSNSSKQQQLNGGVNNSLNNNEKNLTGAKTIGTGTESGVNNNSVGGALIGNNSSTTPNELKLTKVGAKRGAGRRKRQQAQHKAKQLRKELKRVKQMNNNTTTTTSNKV